MKRDRSGREAGQSSSSSRSFMSANGRVPSPTAVVRPVTNGVDGDGSTSVGGMRTATSSSSSATSSAAKRTRFGMEPPEGWRAKANNILSRRTDTKSSAAATTLSGSVSTREMGDVWDKEQQPGRTGNVSATVTGEPRSRRKFAVVCSANFNRSMMAHKLLQDHRFHVQSYGTGRDVRLPGKDVGSPEVFAFGTPYRDIHDALCGKDEDFFRRSSLLGLVARNATIKAAPQRFQEIEGPEMTEFDVVVCFDSRVFYLVVEDLQSRDPELFKPLHVINMSIKDSPEDSAAAAGDVLNLCRGMDDIPNLEDKTASALESFTKKTKRTVLHQVCHV